MFSSTLSSSILIAALSATLALAQDAPLPSLPPTPLADKRFPDPSNLPQRVDTDKGLVRGEQKGYNKCDQSTLGQDSLCQTSWFNSIEDFCLWAPPEAGKDVGSIEGEMVAWCTKPKHGTRLIPAGALQGVQWMKTPDYVQAVGYIDQTLINMLRDDWGGEMDPHGADLRGNPMGGLIYSESFNGKPVQVIEWHNFMGGNFFCLKACDPSKPNAAKFCEHRFDRIGCQFNAPNAAVNGTFEACEGDNQDFPGTYTENGQVKTYTQPGEGTTIATMPYTARVPASSKCVPYTSSVIYAGLPTVGAPAAPTTTTSAPGATTTTTTKSTAAPTNSNSNTNNNNSNQNANSTNNNGATTLAISGISVLGVVFSAIFFA